MTFPLLLIPYWVLTRTKANSAASGRAAERAPWSTARGAGPATFHSSMDTVFSILMWELLALAPVGCVVAVLFPSQGPDLTCGICGFALRSCPVDLVAAWERFSSSLPPYFVPGCCAASLFGRRELRRRLCSLGTGFAKTAVRSLTALAALAMLPFQRSAARSSRRRGQRPMQVDAAC